MNVLVTGSAGYIGAHACLRLLREGHTVIGVDNLFRGHAAAMDLVARATGGASRLHFTVGDINDTALLRNLMAKHKAEAVLHFAAMAYVGESVDMPLAYFRANTAGTVSLLEACAAEGVGRLVFSSSCSTYGEVPADRVPVNEDCPQSQMSPYGRSKFQCEQMIRDFAEGQRRGGKPFAWRALRYFNVAGCDRTGVVGEDHTPETHIIPIVLQAALGQRPHVQVFGTDYPTPDGTCIRDYIHVDDLVDAHVKVLGALRPEVLASAAAQTPAYNLGIGKGFSVRQVIEAARRITGREIRVVESPRRAGDPPMIYADSGRIRAELGWAAQVQTIDEIIGTAWKWFVGHPRGYRS